MNVWKMVKNTCPFFGTFPFLRIASGAMRTKLWNTTLCGRLSWVCWQSIQRSMSARARGSAGKNGVSRSCAAQR